MSRRYPRIVELDEREGQGTRYAARLERDRHSITESVGGSFLTSLKGTNRSLDDADPGDVLVWVAQSLKEPLGRSGQRNPRTIRSRVYVLNRWFDERDMPSPARAPEVAQFLRDLDLQRRYQPKRKKTLSRERARSAMLALDEDVDGELWAKAVFGFAWCSTAFPVEIGMIMGKDVETTAEGIIIILRRTKRGMMRERKWKIAFGPDPRSCAARAVLAWIRRSNAGPDDAVFRVRFRKKGTWKRTDARVFANPEFFRRALELALQKIDLNPDEYDRHSLRRGFVITALENGSSIRQVKARTGHARLATLENFIRGEPIWTNERALI